MTASPDLKGRTRLKGEGWEVHFDDTYSPIFFSISHGLLDLEAMEQWYNVRNPAYDHARRQGHKVVLVSDVGNLAPPDALMRKKIADMGEQEDEAYRDQILGQVFVMSNPVLRGIVTALQWISPNALVQTVTAATLTDARKQVERYYTRAELPMPPYPDDYEYEKITLPSKK